MLGNAERAGSVSHLDDEGNSGVLPKGKGKTMYVPNTLLSYVYNHRAVRTSPTEIEAN